MSSDSTAVNPRFYDGTALENKLDLNGEKPLFLICVGNRSGGKTTYWTKRVIDNYFERGEEFVFVYRYGYELDGVVEKIFGNVHSLFYQSFEMTYEKLGKGTVMQLKIGPVDEDKKLYRKCGYAICLNRTDAVKKYSQVFQKVHWIIFDEFQTEDDQYLSDEPGKLVSAYTSIARGGGFMSRPVQLVMISNPTSILNPYYHYLGIADRLREDTKYIRGDNFVFEQLFNKDAADAQASNSVIKAFSKVAYTTYLTQLKYLNDNKAFLEKPSGRGMYLMTAYYDGDSYGILTYPEDGVYYVSNKVDQTCQNKIAVSVRDHNEATMMIGAAPIMVMAMRKAFNKGQFRFKNAKCREMILNLLTIR
ncbi:MAG: phage DNA encapsidation protein [Clostridium sp.]|nr:phage DNA encapsidation protein [Clostridium sp.]